MAVVYILAHFDDEYCGLPLVTGGVAAGREQHFFYVADYVTRDLAERRFAESRALLAHLGVPADRVIHVGRDTGALDGAVHRALPQAFAALRDALAGIGPVEKIVVPAWEGGHMDHDMCAMMACELAREHGDPPIETISLYNGPGLGGPFFHGGSPLRENGPVTPVKVGLRQWLAWMAAVRFFPSQIKTWAGLWPAMFWSYARGGFGVQRLDPARIRQRPHAGRLFYERMFKVPYDEVRAAADAFLDARLPLHDHHEAG